jgi:predicted DNA-binding WGR domain protein
MASSFRAGSTAGAHSSDCAPSDHVQLLQRLEELELQADLDAQNIAQLREQNKQLDDALNAERAHSEKHAEALMRIARTFDNTFNELKAQHASAITANEDTIAKLEAEKSDLKAANAAAIAKLEEEKAGLEAQVSVLQAQATPKLTGPHTAVESLHTLLPPPAGLLLLASMTFDWTWCAAACRNTWEVDLDANGMRVHVTQDGEGRLTLRSTAPLPHRLARVTSSVTHGHMQKRPGVVDVHSGLAATSHVLEAGPIVYQCTLNQTNISANNNKFYVIQVIEKDDKSCVYCFTRWGRVGVPGATNLDAFSSTFAAIQSFEKKFREKTKNAWPACATDQSEFVQYDGAYQLMDLADDQGTTDALPFRMPLGKISKAQINVAYQHLQAISEELTKVKRSGSVVESNSSMFYTLVPHDFGMTRPPLINNEDMLKRKMEMLVQLTGHEIAHSVSPTSADEHQENRLSAYRVVIESYGRIGSCSLGFLPNHRMRTSTGAAAVTPVAGYSIWNYKGWYIVLDASSARNVDDPSDSGWTALEPSCGAAGDAPGNTSAYATTSKVPAVPAGGAVEFAVDYAAGTCRVAFYTPAAVTGGFVEAPHARMELRFVATEADQDDSPARPIPTLPDSNVELYPAVETMFAAGAIWRFTS